MWRQARKHGCLLFLAGIALLLLLLAGPVDWAWRYMSWRSLSKAELVTAANGYIEDRAPGNRACLYAVSCENGRASLKLIKSLDDWDIQAAKQITWHRKFGGACPGRTANFALELASDKLVGIGTTSAQRRAVWSFYNDRFIPVSGRFHYAAFSEGETEPCISDHAMTGRQISKEGRAPSG